jgi:peptidylprolyl isomerase
MPAMHRPVLALALCVALTGAAAGCGDDNKASTNAATVTNTTPTQTTPTNTTPSTANGTKPKVRVPKGSPPKKLVIKDLKKGKGPVARTGSSVTVQYVGVDYKTGKQFDASWDRGQPFPFQLGAGQVIPGWDRGVAGMRVGGRRELVIPPRLAYGSQGQPPAIAPNATLVFVIDLLGVQ